MVCDFTAWSAAVRPVFERAFAQSALPRPIPCMQVTNWRPRTMPAARFAFPMAHHNFDTEEEKLLRHYSTQSSLTLSPRETLSLFQVSVPGEARSHLYLMHSVLAFAALHLSFVDSQNRYRHSHTACEQHQRAMVAFRASVKQVTLENCGAITAFSFMTVVYTLGLPIVFGFNSMSSPLSTFLDVLNVLRRAWTAIDTALPGLENGQLRELVKPTVGERKQCMMHQKGGNVIRFLRAFLESSPICEKENKHIYREAVFHWENFFMSQPCRPPLWANALVWPMTVSSSFFELLLERRPFPLILLAVWAIALERAPNRYQPDGNYQRELVR